MKRSTAMILTIASILLCGCPGLTACVFGVYALTINQQSLIEAIQAQGFNVQNSGNLPAELIASKIILMIIAVVLIAIPIIVGLITLRRSKGAKNQPVLASMPASMPPARPPRQQPPAMVSSPAPMPPARPPVYEPPIMVSNPAPEPLPIPPVYVPPAPEPAPEPILPAVPAAPPQESAPEPPSAAMPPAAPVMLPEDQPEEPAQVFATLETPAPPMLEDATRVASTWCLVFVSGPSPVSTIVLGNKVSLGRSAENDVAILDPLVSRQHAVVELAPGGGYLVTDLGSANGTFVNDAPLTTPAHLRVGDQVKFGGTVFRFQPLYEMK